MNVTACLAPCDGGAEQLTTTNDTNDTNDTNLAAHVLSPAVTWWSKWSWSFWSKSIRHSNIITSQRAWHRVMSCVGWGGYYFESILLKNSKGVSTGRVLALKSFLLRVTIQSACSSMAERCWVASS